MAADSLMSAQVIFGLWSKILDAFSINPRHSHLERIDLGLIDDFETIIWTGERLMLFSVSLIPAYVSYWNPTVSVHVQLASCENPT
jgi:hypothetical protein